MGTGSRTTACPTCGKLVEWSDNFLYRPFCSERCKLIDLGAWFSEEHAIPGEQANDEENSQQDREH